MKLKTYYRQHKMFVDYFNMNYNAVLNIVMLAINYEVGFTRRT